MGKIGPALGDGYDQSNASVLGVMLLCVREEFERAAARRVEENEALRKLFDAARPVVADEDLRNRLAAAVASRDESLAVSELEGSNAALRGLLIDLHSHVEELDDPQARRIEDLIWRELATSTERRRLSIGPF
jgi:hypothetical protein